jgi:PAS domain S-box-containing protein
MSDENTGPAQVVIKPLAALNSVALAIGRFASLDAMLDYALGKVLDALPTEAGGIYLLDEDRGELTLAVHKGLSERAWRDFDHLRLGEGLSGRVAVTGDPIVIRSLKDDPRLTRMAARLEAFCAFASVPLRSSFKTYGTLNVYRTVDRAFTEEDVQLLTSMASHIGLAVANTRLYLELRASERRFRGLVENAEEVVYLADREHRIVYANPAFSRLLGYDLRDARGQELLSLIHADDRDELASHLPRLMQGEAMRAMELRFVHADGRRVLWFSQTAVPLRDEAGEPTGLQCIAQDITARREWQAQMSRDQRLADLGRMAATIAHEVRNPLGAIVNTINVLGRTIRRIEPAGGSGRHAVGDAGASADSRRAREDDDDVAGRDAAGGDTDTESALQLLDILAQEAARLNATVSDVLLFARPPRRTAIACDVSELVSGTIAFFERSSRLPAGTTIALHQSADLPPVLADPNQMRQVLWNLLSNAAEAMAGVGGTIDLDVWKAADDGSVCIAVTDDGPGVEDPETVLEPFYTTRAQGTGLGLAIVARIVRDHGGRVAVENVPGRGARFTVSLLVSNESTPPL